MNINNIALKNLENKSVKLFLYMKQHRRKMKKNEKK